MELILIVDDSMLQAHALKNILTNDYRVEICTNGLEVLGLAVKLHPSVILMDIVMPDIDGFEVLMKLKKHGATRDIPVIMITSLTGSESEEKGLLLGAVDYITKPFHAGIVKARVGTHAQLYSYRKTVEDMARLDGLTGVINRRFLDKHFLEEWQNAIDYQIPLSIGMLDIDFFKQYNDTYGHLNGDDALKSVAQTISSTICRSNDIVARYGGEEFVFLLPNTTAQEGELFATELCRRIERLAIPHTGSKISTYLTASIGGSTIVPTKEDKIKEFLGAADLMLYKAKQAGRNIALWEKK